MGSRIIFIPIVGIVYLLLFINNLGLPEAIPEALKVKTRDTLNKNK